MSINDILVLNLLLLLVSSQCLCNFSTQIPIEFDETEISKLNLNIKWKADAKQTNQIEPTKFVLIMEQKRFMSTEYSSPVLIDDGKQTKISFNFYLINLFLFFSILSIFKSLFYL